MRVSNLTGQITEYRISTGDQVVVERLEPYSYARHSVNGQRPSVEFRVQGENGAAGSILSAQSLDRQSEVVLVERQGGRYEVRILRPEDSSDNSAPEPDMKRLIEAMLPPLSALLPSKVAILQARRNAEARAKLIQELGALTSTEVADLAGSKAVNRAALAHRWRQEGRIFSVNYEGATLFPAFQFDSEGRPRPIIAEVIRTLTDKTSDWGLALWFTAPNGWLDDQRPVDLLGSDPDSVVRAVEREAEELVF